MADTIVIVGQTGGDDYTAIASALAAVPSDLTATGGNHVIQIRGDQDYSYISTPTVTQDATHRLIITALAGSEVNGTGEGARVVRNNQYNPTVKLNNSHDKISKIRVEQQHTATNAPALQIANSKNNLLAESCFIKGGGGIIIGNGSDIVIDFENCIIAECKGSGVAVGNFNGTATFNKCTSVKNGVDGFENRAWGSGEVIVKNCFGAGNATDDFESMLANSNYNASTDTTAPGTTNFQSRTITTDLEDPNAGTPNYNLKASSALKGAGDGGSDIGATLGAAAPTSESIQIGSGVYLLTGQDVTLTASRSMTLDSGSYAMTGASIGLTASLNMAIDTDAYSMLGSDLSLAKGSSLNISAGSYTMTGNNLGFGVAANMAIGSGLFVMTGSDLGLVSKGGLWTEMPKAQTQWKKTEIVTTTWTEQ